MVRRENTISKVNDYQIEHPKPFSLGGRCRVRFCNFQDLSFFVIVHVGFVLFFVE